MELKHCKYCNSEQSINRFGEYKNRNKTYRRNKCHTCRVKDEKARYKADPKVKERKILAARKSHLKKTYNMTLLDYDKMLTSQNSKCKICNEEKEDILNIDHCHVTNKVRGLLCWDCNIALGKFYDNIQSLKNAVKYLEEQHESID